MQRIRKHGFLFNSILARVLFLVMIALTGAAVAQTAQTGQPAGTGDGKYGGAYPIYRVVNLAPGLLAFTANINAKGQVGFAMQSGGGATGYFYDGAVVHDIGNLGGHDVRVADINADGQLTGTSTTASGTDHAFIWSAGGGMLDLAPNGGYAYGAALNNRGVVTGSFQGTHAFRWSVTTGIEDLGVFSDPGPGLSFGNALNDAGRIAGMASTGANSRHAFIWTRASGLVDIDTLNSLDAMPVVVAPTGEVAGNRMASIASGQYHPFLWTRASGMVDLGTGGGTAAFVEAMTPGLQMAGIINTRDGNQRAMWWTRATGMRSLGTLGGQSSRGADINAAGQIVGSSLVRSGAWHAFLWSRRLGMIDLNNYLRHAPRGLVLDYAVAINDDGAIVASSNAGLVLLKPDGGHTGGHVLGPIVAPALVKAGMPVTATVAFVDEDGTGTRSATWSWDDGTDSAGAIETGTVSGTHSFAAPGIYHVTATVVDRAGRSTAVGHDVVVSATAGATIAGLGTVMAPAGAFRQAPFFSGRARFSLVAPLATTAAVAGATAQLQFDLPGFSLRSQDVRLIERDGTQYVFAGSGTVRGARGYQFRLTTSATTPGGEPGAFGIKIWHADRLSNVKMVDYDNTDASSGTNGARITDGAIVLE